LNWPIQNELYQAIKKINIENLNEDDKEELIKIFEVTNNSHIRNQLALIFADLNYNKAVPYIIRKINDRKIFNYIGTLVYSLEGLDVKIYFLTFIRVICEHEYEARISAYSIVEKFAASISKTTRKKALQVLNYHHVVEEQKEIQRYENSILHFIDATIKLLSEANS
jgi:hypothetical protein